MKYINFHIILMLMFVATFTGCEQKILFEDEAHAKLIPEEIFGNGIEQRQEHIDAP